MATFSAEIILMSCCVQDAHRLIAEHGGLAKDPTRRKSLPCWEDGTPMRHNGEFATGDRPKLQDGLRGPLSVLGHRSVVMFGVLVIVFRRHNITRPGFFLGKRD